MSTTASKIVSTALAQVGRKEADGTHRIFIDIYNSQNPLPRNYKVQYNDSWCAVFDSALAILNDATDIIPIECGVGEKVELAKKMGIWVEDDNHVPSLGEIAVYDWSDGTNYKQTDNKEWPDHEGTVVEVSEEEGYFLVVEGNKNDAVETRGMNIGGRYIRGFICPKYDAEPQSTETSLKGDVKVTIELSVLRKGGKGKEVGTLQTLLMAKGYEIGAYGIDGDFGNDTEKAVRQFQKDEGIEVDGIVGFDTWSRLLK